PASAIPRPATLSRRVVCKSHRSGGSGPHRLKPIFSAQSHWNDMPASSSLESLIKWLRRDPWREAFEEVLWLHVGPACEQAGIEFEDIEDILGHLEFMTLWGCAFEDFLTRTCEPDERNIVDDYLKRR